MHRNQGCRLREFEWRGYRCVSIENEQIRLLINADRGAEIAECTYKPLDIECLYQSSAGPGYATDRASSYTEGGAFRDRFSGGWFDMIPNGPVPCQWRGASFGHHGEAHGLGWNYRIVEDTAEHCAVVFDVVLRRMPIHVSKTIRLRGGYAEVVIESQIRNISEQAIEAIWGQHPCFGPPFVTASTTVVIDDVSGPDGTLDRDGFEVFESILGRVTLVSNDLPLTLTLRYPPDVFPKLGVWSNWARTPDYPAYNARRLLAIEPATSFSALPEAVANDEVIRLAPFESKQATLALEFSLKPSN